MTTWPTGGSIKQARPSYAKVMSLKTMKVHCTVIQGVTTFDFTFKKDDLGESIETNDVKEWLMYSRVQKWHRTVCSLRYL